jgi:general secretion pathway protein B
VSFILDALRKSEHERQRSAVPGLAQVPLATPAAQLPRWALLVMGLLLAAVLILGGAWWQSTRTPMEAAPPAVVERSLPLPAPSVAPPPVSVAPADRAATLRASASEPAVAPTREGSLATAAAPSSTESADGEPLAAAPQPSTPADALALPSAAALAAEGVFLPHMNLELLAFREQPRDRFVFINGRKYVEGERLVEGPQVVSIVPTGAVLLHAGRRFLLVSK